MKMLGNNDTDFEGFIIKKETSNEYSVINYDGNLLTEDRFSSLEDAKNFVTNYNTEQYQHISQF